MKFETKIVETKSTQEIADLLVSVELHGLSQIVLSLQAEGVILQSLQLWTLFCLSFALPKQLPVVPIKTDEDGCIRMEWGLAHGEFFGDPDNDIWGEKPGVLSLSFFPSGLIHSCITADQTSRSPTITMDNLMPLEKTANIIMMVYARIQHKRGEK